MCGATTRERRRTKYTDALDAWLREIVEEEGAKTRRRGRGHKQKLTNRQIFEKVKEVYLLIKKSTAQYDLNPLSFLQRPLS